MPADGTTQRYKYNKEQLVALSHTTGAKMRPHFLKLEFFNDSGVWDPEKWVLGERNDEVGSGTKTATTTTAAAAVSSSLDEGKGKRERPADLDRESLTGKRRSADPKERLKEDQDGIILSPQRRSFGTGCHVTQQITGSSIGNNNANNNSSNSNVNSGGGNRRSESPELRFNDRDNHREPSRRIGSGRFSNRERERDRERDFGYRGGDLHGDGGRRSNDSRDLRSGGGGGGGYRFRRDDGNRMGRDISSKDYDRRSNHKEKNFRRIEEEEEPEWFSCGPSSQSETIELRGFDDVTHHSSSSASSSDDQRLKRERRKSWRKSKTPTIEEEEESAAAAAAAAAVVVVEKQQQPPIKKDEKEEEAAVRSEGDGEEDPNDHSNTTFDFGDLFKFDAIASIFPNTQSTSPETVENNSLIGSRFGQFFRKEVSSPSAAALTSAANVNLTTVAESGDTSRRSSFQDELIVSNLNEPSESPTSGSDTYFAPISPAQLTKRSKGDKKGKQLLNLHKLETGLKSLVLGSGGGGGSGLANGGQSAEAMNAFEKLLSQMSDSPAARPPPVSVAVESEKKSIQSSEFHLPLHSSAHSHSQSKLHMMEQRTNIPSPLIFRQDPPPAISHAPSPIHPAQIVQSMAPLNPNSLQAGHILTRVPSPQELRQQQPPQMTLPLTKPIPSPSLSIIPTSVMRKMQIQMQQRALNQQLNKGYLATPAGIDIAKQLILQQQMNSQRQMNISPLSVLTTTTHPGLPIRPATYTSPSAMVNPIRPAPNSSSSAAAAAAAINNNNNFLMRNLVHNAAPSLSQYNQMATTYQRHATDPRQLQAAKVQQQQTTGGQSHLHHLLMTGGGGGVQQSRALVGNSNNISPGSRPIQPQSFNNFLKSVSGNDVLSQPLPPSTTNFDKWFGSDLRHKMTNLPPVPTQKAQYVEEVEQRHTQTVLN
ncbi:eukaryotic translation initiation factor 4E nuclear import factor 1 [Chamberlinius hualienensis]